MRQISLDTETTGIGRGHKIIEIGCLEIIDRVLTGKKFHVYLNPYRKVDDGAFRVHGLSNEFLEDKPIFTDIMPEFLDFVKDAELIIHNAPFDTGFLNYELDCTNHPHTIEHYCKIFDTLPYARKKHPGMRNSLDALCKRYEIDNSNRDLHGALLDADLLAQVYLAMTGGQRSFFDDEFDVSGINIAKTIATKEVTINALLKTSSELEKPNTPIIYASEDEILQHNEFLEYIEKCDV